MFQSTINSGYWEPAFNVFFMRPPALHHLNILPFQLSQYILNNGGVMAGEEAAAERYENIHGDRYEDIQGTESFITNQVRTESRPLEEKLSN